MNMQRHDAAPKKSPTEARQGEATGRMRLVLVASLILVIILFALTAVIMSRI